MPDPQTETAAAAPHAYRWLVLFGVWTIYFAFGLIATSLAPLVGQIESDLAISHTAMGSIMGAWQLVFIAAALPCGLLLDRLGMRWALVLGAASIAASAFGRSLAGDYLGLLLAVMVFGVGGPIISAGAPKVIATWFEGRTRGLAMGIYVTGPSIGAIASLTLTHPVLLPLAGGQWRPLFVLWALVAIAAGGLWWLIASLPAVRRQTDRISTQAPVPHRRVVAQLISARPVQILMLMSVGVFGINHGLMNWLPELLVAHGMDVARAGYWAALPTAVGIFGSLSIPRLATPDRRFFILSGLCLSMVAATLALQFDHPGILTAGLVFQGIARATLMTVLMLILVELPGVGDRHAGTAAGLFFAAAEIGGMLGPLLIGVTYDASAGFGVGLGLCSLVSLGLFIGAGSLRRTLRQAGESAAALR